MDDEDVVSEVAVEFPLLLLFIELLELLLIKPPTLLLFKEPLESKEASIEDNFPLMVSVMELKLLSIPDEEVVVLCPPLLIAVLALALAAAVLLLVVL